MIAVDLPILRAIVYVSSSTWTMSDVDLEVLLTQARDLNRQHGITGVLLYHGGTFMQYLEGEIDDVLTTYNRILVSKRHHQIIELMNCPIPARDFGDWFMGLGTPTKSQLLDLVAAQWRQHLVRRSDVAEEPLGLKLLRRFWCTAVGGAERR
jgi:Sensors of blue-light using FAD